jgi:hypothetical protein
MVLYIRNMTDLLLILGVVTLSSLHSASLPVKYVKGNRDGKYHKITTSDMDYYTKFAMTRAQLIKERDAINEVLKT